MTQIPPVLQTSIRIPVKPETSSNKNHNTALTILAMVASAAVGALLISYGRSWFSGPALFFSESDVPTHVVKSVDHVGNSVLKLEPCPRDKDGLFVCSNDRPVVYEPFQIEGHRFFHVRQCTLGENNIFDCPEGDLDIPTQWLRRGSICSKELCFIYPFEDTPKLGQCLKDECSPLRKGFWS